MRSQRANDWCKHYNGTVNDACKAGVRYELVRLGFGTPQFSLPCIKDRNELGATCDKCEFRTPEEIAEYEAAMEKRFADTVKARAAIVAHLGGPWKRGMPGAGGAIHCPVCEKPGETLRFTRAGVNGHIHAACAGCVSWME